MFPTSDNKNSCTNTTVDHEFQRVPCTYRLCFTSHKRCNLKACAAMFELELEWIVGAGSGEKQEDYCPNPLPTSSFWLSLTPLVSICFALNPSLLCKSKISAIIFTKKIPRKPSLTEIRLTKVAKQLNSLTSTETYGLLCFNGVSLPLWGFYESTFDLG